MFLTFSSFGVFSAIETEQTSSTNQDILAPVASR